MKRFALAAMAIMSFSTVSLAAEPIVGKWRAPGGGIVEVSACGNAFCAEVISGQHAGKSAGQMSSNGSGYEGTVTDPRDDRTYQGTAVIEGNQLKLTGCALSIFCKTQVWTRA
ncbi:MAG: DUF2147 domain-containing protein [Aurantimonas endophytica]|uniref:Uncharacterized protein (DUF2147 family) n=1 Tax=Aurantimonas endophytica TaxID=1522175 RepID=A0A7W6MQR9_9HYPH|nr:DUF2147 domain-containing protein [Aurantimonas endophytica]MBB4004262.1 uncharacterized protein (DUF2147 family) [Aurantimonas endophytica]MCO6405102.1 DUF2147 domain-containing protein [Aurantimonas endophytica]